MVENDKITGNVLELENLLVKQLRALQDFLDLTRREREALLNNQKELMGLVEDKEALLDKLSLVEDQRRKIVQELAVALGLQNGDTSIRELLPHIPDRESIRINHLSEGITTLAVQAKEMNQANQALVCVRMDWLHAAQSFLLSLAQPEASYRPPAQPASVDTAVWGLEFRA